jgi:hypothetical protein
MNTVLIVGLKRPETGLLKLIDGNMTPKQLHLVRTRSASTDVTNPYRFSEYCQGVEDLVKTVRLIHRISGPIDLLDLVDHGAPGVIDLGDDVLFEWRGGTLTVGAATARRLTPYLAPRGCVRLLGCETARDVAGRELLVTLAKHFPDGMQLYGTIDRVVREHFKRGIFRPDDEFLYSADAAVDAVAPSLAVRVDNILRRSRPPPVSVSVQRNPIP